MKWPDGILLQPGQAGGLFEASEVAKLFKQKSKKIIVGRRSGETCDPIIVYFAITIQAEYSMAGGLVDSKLTAKYNHLIRISECLRDKSLLSLTF